MEGLSTHIVGHSLDPFRGGPLPSIDVADALLDERRELDRKLTGS
jgi:hypothetical protein